MTAIKTLPKLFGAKWVRENIIAPRSREAEHFTAEVPVFGRVTLTRFSTGPWRVEWHVPNAHHGVQIGYHATDPVAALTKADAWLREHAESMRRVPLG